jgi:hypothetical protein
MGMAVPSLKILPAAIETVLADPVLDIPHPEITPRL